MASDPDYPARWEAEVLLADGGTMAVRPIRPDDAERIVRFHERQSPESIYFRFFSPRPRLSERDLERFTHVDYVDRMAFVGLIGDELVGVARYDRHRARSDAEVAFFIDDEHHGRGMATVLLEYLAAAAREAGISGFTATVLPQNRKMLGVFTQAGFTARSHLEEGVVEVELGIEPTPEALAAIEVRAATAEARSVRRILAPGSIAVVGASRQPGTVGHQVFHQLVSHGFCGPVYPVNAEATHVASVRSWRSVLDVPGELDLAVICVPADQVRRVLEECAVKRVQAVIIVSAGFADRDEEGARAEEELVTFARRHGMRVVGPAALGVINTDPTVRMHATFIGVEPIRGRIGLLAQSGVIGAAIIDGARQLGLGISSFLATGNKADVSGNDLLRYWYDDPNTDVAMLYLESFGNPSKFSRTARALARTKPVVAVKVGGEVSDGWDAVGDWPEGATVAALLEQAGVIRVDNLTQMFHTAGVLTDQPLPNGRRVAVVTNSWGPAWLAVDALRAHGLDPADPVVLEIPGGATEGSSEAQVFADGLARLYAAGEADAVLVIYAPSVATHYTRVGRAIREAGRHPNSVTTVACLLGQHGPSTLADGVERVPQFPFPEEAAAALGRVAHYAAWRARPAGEAFELDAERLDVARSLVSGWVPGGASRWLDVLEASQLLATAGLATVDQRVVDGVDAVVAAAAELGYPVALKATGLERLSRSESGGVALDVHNEAELRDAHARMDALLGAALRPAVVQRMADEGAEVRVAILRHEVLGDIITLGPGGAAAERVAGESLRILPLTDVDARELLAASPVGEVVAELGPGAEAVLVDLLIRLAALAEAVPEIASVRLNPILVHGADVSITDVRVRLQGLDPDPRPPVRRL